MKHWTAAARTGSNSGPRRPLPVVAAWSAVLVLLAAAAAARWQPVQEELLVREVEVLIEAPREAAVARRSLEENGLLVEEDGTPRTLANVARLSPGERWRVVVFLDSVLAAPELIAAGAMTAAVAAEELAALGTVEVVAADPSPRVLLPATGDREAIAATLAEAAAAALREMRARPEPGPAGAALTPERAAGARRQSDRLLAWLARRGTGVPRLLVLVTDGTTLSPAGMNYAAGASAVPPPPEKLWVDSVAETARSLGALGWTVAVLAPRAEALRLSALPEADSDRYRRKGREELMQGAPTDTVNLTAISQLLSGRGDFSPGLAVGDAVDLRRPGLRPLAAETGGAVLGRDGELEILIERLRRRWLLAYQSPSPRDGRQHRVRVRAVADGRELEGQRWTGSALESVTAARLRLLLAGEMPADDSDLEVAAHRDGDEVVLDVKAAKDEGAESDLRLAAAYVTPEGGYQVVIRERGAAAAGSWRLPIPHTAGKLAVALENVRLETWAGALVTIPERSLPPPPVP